MKQKTFITVSSWIFLAIAVLHAGRIIGGWISIIDGVELPMWPSWVAVLVAGFLAYQGYRLNT